MAAAAVSKMISPKTSPTSGTFGSEVLVPAVLNVAVGAYNAVPTPPSTPGHSSKNSPIEENEHPGPLDPENPRIIEEAKTPPKTSLTWEDVLALLQAAHNPRFCGTLATAKANIANGAYGDSCSLIGGFQSLVQDRYVIAALGLHVESPSVKSWKDLTTTLARLAPAKQSSLCIALYKALIDFFRIALKTNRTTESTVVMVRATMAVSDQGNAYGPLGKSGAKMLAAKDFSAQIFHGTVWTGVDEKDQVKYESIMAGVVAMATKIVQDRPAEGQ